MGKPVEIFFQAMVLREKISGLVGLRGRPVSEERDKALPFCRSTGRTHGANHLLQPCVRPVERQDRKSTRLNSSHQIISYAVFCLKKKKTQSLYPICSSPYNHEHT